MEWVLTDNETKFINLVIPKTTVQKKRIETLPDRNNSTFISDIFAIVDREIVTTIYEDYLNLFNFVSPRHIFHFYFWKNHLKYTFVDLENPNRKIAKETFVVNKNPGLAKYDDNLFYSIHKIEISEELSNYNYGGSGYWKPIENGILFFGWLYKESINSERSFNLRESNLEYFITLRKFDCLPKPSWALSDIRKVRNLLKQKHQFIYNYA